MKKLRKKRPTGKLKSSDSVKKLIEKGASRRPGRSQRLRDKPKNCLKDSREKPEKKRSESKPSVRKRRESLLQQRWLRSKLFGSSRNETD